MAFDPEVFILILYLPREYGCYSLLKKLPTQNIFFSTSSFLYLTSSISISSKPGKLKLCRWKYSWFKGRYNHGFLGKCYICLSFYRAVLFFCLVFGSLGSLLTLWKVSDHYKMVVAVPRLLKRDIWPLCLQEFLSGSPASVSSSNAVLWLLHLPWWKALCPVLWKCGLILFRPHWKTGCLHR